MSVGSSLPTSENVIDGGATEEENEADSDGLPVSLQQGEEYQVGYSTFRANPTKTGG